MIPCKSACLRTFLLSMNKNTAPIMKTNKITEKIMMVMKLNPKNFAFFSTMICPVYWHIFGSSSITGPYDADASSFVTFEDIIMFLELLLM